MNEFSVPTVPLRVTAWLTDGKAVEGDVFLPARSPVRDGPMLAAEWVNVAPTFVPLRPATGRDVMLLCRAQVVAFALPEGVMAADPLDGCDAPVRRVAIELVGGLRLEGRVAVNMPHYQQRVVDWMNGADAYVVLDARDRAHLIQKAHITRVIEFGED